jgi:hypothetical protein
LSHVCDRAEIFLTSGYVSYLAVLIGSPGLFRMAMMVLGFRGGVVSFLLQYVELLELSFGIQLAKPVWDSDLENWVTGDGNRHRLSVPLRLGVLLTTVLLVSLLVKLVCGLGSEGDVVGNVGQYVLSVVLRLGLLLNSFPRLVNLHFNTVLDNL